MTLRLGLEKQSVPTAQNCTHSWWGGWEQGGPWISIEDIVCCVMNTTVPYTTVNK